MARNSSLRKTTPYFVAARSSVKAATINSTDHSSELNTGQLHIEVGSQPCGTRSSAKHAIDLPHVVTVLRSGVTIVAKAIASQNVAITNHGHQQQIYRSLQ